MTELEQLRYRVEALERELQEVREKLGLKSLRTGADWLDDLRARSPKIDPEAAEEFAQILRELREADYRAAAEEADRGEAGCSSSTPT
jgi:hypothetical protein